MTAGQAPAASRPNFLKWGGIILLLVVLLLIAPLVIGAPLLFVGVPALISFLQANFWLFRFIVAATAVLLVTVPTAFVIIYLELKVIALMNLRIGPNRVGPAGAAQSVIHGLKVLTKEDFSPTGVDVPVFTLAPAVTFLSAVMTLMVIPFAPGLFGVDMNLGLLYFFAVSGLSVLGLLMAGWSSFNKYSLLGGLRSAAQVVSYEIPLTLSVVGLILLAGSMSMNRMVLMQSGSILDWNFIRQPLGLLIFFIAATAEGNRTPFDLTEADSELVGGFATEYSGMRFGFFFFAEYVSVFILSALTVTLFFGGWTAPFRWPWAVNIGALNLTAVPIWQILLVIVLAPIVVTLVIGLPLWLLRTSWSGARAFGVGFLVFNLVAIPLVLLGLFLAFDWVAGIVWFMMKTYAFVFLFVWMRATLPRVRVDQLMGFAWKWLLPASLLNLFVTAAAIVLVHG